MTVAWRKPSRCEASSCVAVAGVDGMVLVTGTSEDAHILEFTPAEWAAHVAAVKAGEYDDLIGEQHGEGTG